MTIKNTFIDITGDGSGMDDILNIEITEAYKQPTSRFTLETRSVGTFTLNDIINTLYELFYLGVITF